MSSQKQRGIRWPGEGVNSVPSAAASAIVHIG
jgi:hypothetical protein